MISQLLCLGRHTVTGIISTAGEQFHDWSAFYRLFSKQRCDCEKLFDVIRSEIVAHSTSTDPFVVSMDDSLLRKTGRKIPHVKYCRDPLSPPFHVNFVRGQRVLQLSAAITSSTGDARMIPVNFISAPSATKPGKHATDEERARYDQEKKEKNINTYGCTQIAQMRHALDCIDKNRILWIEVDGRFTNATIIKHLPHRTVLTGRIRSDAKLYYPVVAQGPHTPGQEKQLGRKKRYGERAPTPEECRTSDAFPWQEIEAYATGKRHTFRIKTLTSILWRTAGTDTLLRLIVIAPLSYRLRKHGKLLYRKPAYLICTDPSAPIESVLQAYLWRWDIEVNFRDEKQIIGVGEAQVRNEASVRIAPAFAVAAYSFLLMAGVNTFGVDGIPDGIPEPKWRTAASQNCYEVSRRASADGLQSSVWKKKKRRASLQDLQRDLRMEVWGEALGDLNFSGFSVDPPSIDKPQKFDPPIMSAVFYATA